MTVQELLKAHPDWPGVQAIYHKLVAGGYKAFLAGGCVRDALLGRNANDLDLATDARPDQVEELFEKTIPVGKSFGVIRVIEQGAEIEVASFRMDGLYEDGRRPLDVEWATPEEDAKRRDFTVNAMFWDLQSEVVVDYVQGLEDLSLKVLRAVGEPKRRFAEDHLRLLRAVRFAGQLEFEIEPQTFAAICDLASTIRKVSGERLREEMTKLLLSKGSSIALGLLRASGLEAQIFPQHQLAEVIQKKSFKESWQAWVLYFEKNEIALTSKSLKDLKFSNKETLWIGQALGVLQNPPGYFSLRFGQQLEKLSLPGVEYAVSLLIERAEFSSFVKPLEQAWLRLQRQLPAPYLRGDDILPFLQGPEIRDCLSLAYWEQLEEKITSRSEALAWLQTFVQKSEE